MIFWSQWHFKTVGISYNIENFKAKISNVHDDQHLRCQHASQVQDMSKLSGIPFIGDIGLLTRKGTCF